MNNRGQVVALFQYVVVVLVLGILLYAFNPVISTVWNLNVNLPNYELARSILDLYPLFAIIGITLLYVITRPRENPVGG